MTNENSQHPHPLLPLYISVVLTIKAHSACHCVEQQESAALQEKCELRAKGTAR